MIINVTMSLENNYKDYGICEYHIDADVLISKSRFGEDADGKRGIDTFQYELRNAVVYVDIFDSEGQVIKTIKEDANGLTDGIVERIFDKAMDLAVTTYED
jgi:hypothetical protein